MSLPTAGGIVHRRGAETPRDCKEVVGLRQDRIGCGTGRVCTTDF